MGFVIWGFGAAVPDHVITQRDGMQLNQTLCGSTDEQATWLPQMYRQSGVSKRHFALEQQIVRDVLEQTDLSGSVFLPQNCDHEGPTTGARVEYYTRFAGPLAHRAAADALTFAGLMPGDITHLITVSCTGFRSPGVDYELINSLGLPATTQRTHIGFMGCHAGLNGLRVARALSVAEPGARVLVCAVELCCLHYCYTWDAQNIVANALFADGAAATVGGKTGPRDAWELTANGACIIPDSADAMTWTIGDHGFRMTLSKRVPAYIARHLRPFLTDWLGQHDLSIEEIGSWAVHPGGPKILTAVAETLCLPDGALQTAEDVLASHGNMSSATILFVLRSLVEQQAPRPCVALAFGPGLAVEAALFR